MISFHADDFAVSYHSSQDIISLCKQGCLDGISVIPNMSCFEPCVSLYKKESPLFPHTVHISIHLNFMEGHCVSSPSLLPHLVDKNGFFSISWGKLFIYSFTFLRKQIANELAIESIAQIHKLLDSGICTSHIFLDSHQHTHFIPVVSNALNIIINSPDYSVEYIRNPRELLSVYKNNSLYKFHIKGINILKCLILSFLSRTSMHMLQTKQSNCSAVKFLPQEYLCGILFSGRMDERLYSLVSNLKQIRDSNVCNLELLFHPGSVLKTEITHEYCKKGFVSFHLSPNRKVEYQTVCKLYKILH